MHRIAAKSVFFAKKRPDRLRWRLIGRSPLLLRNTICALFDRTLQLDPSKHIAARKVRWIHVHQKRRVRILAIASVIAHAVGNDAARLASCGNYLSTRTHAEAVHAASARKMDGQLVFGRAERRVRCRASPLRFVDERLRMLYAHPHREGLLLHGEARITNELERVARRMTAC